MPKPRREESHGVGAVEVPTLPPHREEAKTGSGEHGNEVGIGVVLNADESDRLGDGVQADGDRTASSPTVLVARVEERGKMEGASAQPPRNTEEPPSVEPPPSAERTLGLARSSGVIVRTFTTAGA